MLIEAAKGGHTTVVNLLLEWPNTQVSPNSNEALQISSPDQQAEVPRVPIQGLNNIVPPHDPDQSGVIANLAAGGVACTLPLAGGITCSLASGLPAGTFASQLAPAALTSQTALLGGVGGGLNTTLHTAAGGLIGHNLQVGTPLLAAGTPLHALGSPLHVAGSTLHTGGLTSTALPNLHAGTLSGNNDKILA